MVVSGKDISTVGKVSVGTDGLTIGSSFNITNGVSALSYKLPDGSDAFGLSSVYDENGTDEPFYHKFLPREDFPINTATGTTITTPFSTSYNIQGNNLVYDLKFIPKSSGDFRVRYYLSTFADQEKLIFDSTRFVTQDEVDAGVPVSFGEGNKFLVPAGETIFVLLEGIELNGGTVSGGPLDGQVLPYLVTVVQEYEKRFIFGFGWFNYDNSITSQRIPPGVWTTLQNDGAGPATNLQFPPYNVTRLLDTSTGKLLLDELEAGDEVYVRYVVDIQVLSNYTTFSFSHLFGESSPTRFPMGSVTSFTEGAGLKTGDMVIDTNFYVLDQDTVDGGALPQIFATNEVDVNYKSCYISVTRRA